MQNQTNVNCFTILSCHMPLCWIGSYNHNHTSVPFRPRVMMTHGSCWYEMLLNHIHQQGKAALRWMSNPSIFVLGLSSRTRTVIKDPIPSYLPYPPCQIYPSSAGAIQSDTLLMFSTDMCFVYWHGKKFIGHEQLVSAIWQAVHVSLSLFLQSHKIALCYASLTQS